MRILICPDSFKETLSSEEVISAISEGMAETAPSIETIGLPMTDGGEGFRDILIHNTGGSIIDCKAHGALMEEIESWYGVLGEIGRAHV